MIQHDNNLKSLPANIPIIRTITSFQQGLTASIFTLAANNNRVKLSVQNLGMNDINIWVGTQLISVIGGGFTHFLPDSEARLSIGLSSELGANALVVSYLSV
ncbi:hypothetical protein NG798_00630 [Ancylothrix sp. C2]|uniref:hypothetical protein n=1 Tax=Ancylothrix sp. D3o TaxID=2953691 RepID=UPI0021BA7825|nr:hypothetical protein [Ancylothrix sp. D3o]MCT7948298.1 hypothetical protein [Ancylothrix sp. D3o]